MDSDEEEEVYNPLDIPLGWDGKPIPYWLYKLHGLNQVCVCFVYFCVFLCFVCVFMCVCVVMYHPLLNNYFNPLHTQTTYTSRTPHIHLHTTPHTPYIQ